MSVCLPIQAAHRPPALPSLGFHVGGGEHCGCLFILPSHPLTLSSLSASQQKRASHLFVCLPTQADLFPPVPLQSCFLQRRALSRPISHISK